MVNLTPAFAIQMEQVADDAQKYNEESQKKMGFFKKIGFMAKGFKLLNKAQDAQKKLNTTTNEEQNDLHKKLFYHTVLTEIQKHNLLKFKNNDSNTLNLETTSKNNHFQVPTNETNQTNHTDNNTNQTLNSGLNIPSECYDDIHNVINMLLQQGFTVSQELKQEISPSLQGTIVQLIDEEGNIRYAYVKELDLKTGNVTLITDKDKEISMGMEEFKTSFKGLTINIGPTNNPEVIMDKITQLQKDTINNDKTQAESAKEDATNKMILWGILLGVGVILMVVGIILAIYFGKELASEVQNLGNTATTRFRVGFQSPEVLENICHYENTVKTPDRIIFETYRTLNDAMTMNTLSFTLETLATFGIIIVSLSGVELFMNACAQNWIKVIICTVGIITFVVGLGLTIASIILLLKAYKNSKLANFSLKLIEKRNTELNKFLNRAKEVNDTNRTLINNTENNKIQSAPTNKMNNPLPNISKPIIVGL